MAAYPSTAWKECSPSGPANHVGPVERVKLLEFTGVFSGREITRKDRHLSSGLPLIDSILGGGIVRGRISEITGPTSVGKTSLAASFVAAATRRGETTAWIDSAGSFDPATIAASGVDLARVLWIHSQADPSNASISPKKPPAWNAVRAAEPVLAAGDFGLVVIDFGSFARTIPPSVALRIARLAERTGAAVIVLAAHRMCGTFAAMSLALDRDRAYFSRSAVGAPPLFDGFVIETRVARNKLGGIGARARWHALAERFPFPLVGKEPGIGPLQSPALSPSPAKKREREPHA